MWLLVLIPLAIVGFWAWMFWDMTNNDSLPPCFLSITNNKDPRSDWMLAFIILNIFTAGFYYLAEYKNR